MRRYPELWRAKPRAPRGPRPTPVINEKKGARKVAEVDPDQHLETLLAQARKKAVPTNLEYARTAEKSRRPNDALASYVQRFEAFSELRDPVVESLGADDELICLYGVRRTVGDLTAKDKRLRNAVQGRVDQQIDKVADRVLQDPMLGLSVLKGRAELLSSPDTTDAFTQKTDALRAMNLEDFQHPERRHDLL